ncbi:MAG: alpha/beta fold hydrolase [Cyanobacteria bacterium]|nr:alpha/beta fold hydrolase [Cyanobacteriota bacterium]
MAASQALVQAAARSLIDPQARALASSVEWWPGPDRAPGSPGLQTPVAVLGQGPTVLLLHGFDSSFLEFRRLAPLLASDHRLVIPDLHGFGFSPRPASADYDPEAVLRHLDGLLPRLGPGVGLIGASMGGAVAVELARRHPETISRLLLLAPAGLTGRPMPVPPLLDALGVRFLARPGVRRGLCRSAFADPEAAVGPAELEIASVHLPTPGWADALRRFARSGGFAGCGAPLPAQPLAVLWGKDDRILRPPQKRAAQALLGNRIEELEACGHLPHLDQPATVAAAWRQGSLADQGP